MRVTLKHPQAPFLANLAMFTVRHRQPEGRREVGHGVSASTRWAPGAFKFVEWKPNQEVVLEANPDYWGEKAKVKRVVVRNIKDNSAAAGRAQGG